MKKQSFYLLGLLLCGLTLSASAQRSSPVPLETRTWVNVHPARHIQRLRHPEAPPAGGFWVSEDNLRNISPVIIRYYDDQQRELQADTLRQTSLMLKSRVVRQLNERLARLLENRQQPVALARPN